MKKLYLLVGSLLALMSMRADAQVSGIAGYLLVGRSTVAAMPAANTVVRGLWIVTDASTTSTCATGGGANVVVCVDQGATWAALTGGGGAPDAHASTHQDAGSDEINVAGLTGLLATAQTPAAHTQAASTISDSTAAGRALLVAADATAQRTALGLGTAATKDVPAAGDAAVGEVVKGDDTRLSDARAATAHATSHQHGGADEIATATPSANAIPKAGAGGTIAAGWLPTLTPGDVGLGSVTNDVQTKASVVPNTAPSAGQILVGNAGGTAYAPQTMSGDATLDSAGALTIAADSVALTTDTTGNYAAGDAEAGAALTGDSATAFFSAGTIEAARLPDLSALSGAVTDAQVPDTITASNYAPLAGATFTGATGVDNAQGFRLFEADVNGANYVEFVAPAALTSNTTCTLEDDGNPIPDSCVGDGVDGGGSTSPGGSDTQVQFNDGGAFGGDAGFTYNKTTDTPTINGFTLSLSTTFAGGATGWRLTRGGTALTDLSFFEQRRVILSNGSNHLCLDLAGSGVLSVFDYLCTTRGDMWLRDVYLYGGANRELVLSSQVNRVSMASDWKIAWNNSTTEGYDGSDELAIEMQTTGVAKLSDALRLNPRSSPPVTCGSANTAGVVYYDSDSNEICTCNGTAWTGLIAGGSCA